MNGPRVVETLAGRTGNIMWTVSRSPQAGSAPAGAFVYVIRIGKDPLEMQLTREARPLTEAELRSVADDFVRWMRLEV